MIQTVMNLQEAYAKALLVDRDALRARAVVRRCPCSEQDPRRRVQHRRAAPLREGARRPRYVRRPDRLVPGRWVRGTCRAGPLARESGCMALTTSPKFENHWNPPAGLSELEALVYRSKPAGLRSGDRQLRRRQHVGQDARDRPCRARDDRAVGEGLGQRPRDDRFPAASPACGSRRSSRSRSETR